MKSTLVLTEYFSNILYPLEHSHSDDCFLCILAENVIYDA